MKLKNLTNVPDSERRPMTPAESDLMIVLTISGQDISEQVPAADLEASLLKLFKPAMTSSFCFQVMLKRLQLTDKLYDPRVVAMTAFIADRPGFAVLWAYTLFQRTLELGRPYNFDDLVHDFPMGFPTNDGAAKIWDAQKAFLQEPPLKGDNLLDQAEAWKAPEDATA